MSSDKKFIFLKLEINGAYIVKPKPFIDERGVFRRSFCEKEFKDNGLTHNISQSNISENYHKHTLRGFHYQIEPFSEAKTMTCLNGAIYDIIVDLRPDSPTYLQWENIELNSTNQKSIYIPKGCANSFLTLKNNTIVVYFSSSPYNPDYESGIKYNDPLFNFKWPVNKPKYITQKDLSWKNYTQIRKKDKK